MKKSSKTISTMILATCIITGFTGCSTSYESTADVTAYETINGQTSGSSSESSDDKGSARFKVKGNHVKLTNFEFDADSSLKVECEIENDDFIYAQALVHDGDNILQNIADGHYKETFTKKDIAAQLSNIYRTIFATDDDDFDMDDITLEDDVYYIKIGLSDGELILMAKKDSDEYVSIAYTSTDYGVQDIVDAAFDALD